MTRQNLDAIMIPTGPRDLLRAEKAYEHYRNNSSRYFLITGEIQRDNMGKVKKDAQPYQIYKLLRNYGIKPSQIIVEGKSKNTLENVLNSLEELKARGLKEIGVSTGKTHYWRFDELIERAKQEGIIDKNFHIYHIPVPENAKEKAYGIGAYLKDHLKLRRYGLKSSSKTSRFINALKMLSRDSSK